MTYKEYKDTFSKEEQKKFLEYLASKELEEWKAILADDNAPTIENVKKVFDNGWQWWNTYSRDEDVEKVDKNGISCDCMDFGLVDWEQVFRLAREDNNFYYNIHQYCDWIVIFVYFEKDGIKIDCPFLNDGWEYHLEEDMENGCYSEDFIREAISTPIEVTWKIDGCYGVLLTEKKRS